VQQLNVGTLDAAIRWLIAAVLGVASVALDVPMSVSLLLAMIALGMAASALMHFCPLYARLGMSTRHRAPMASTRHP
jgi:hypothetical protein